MSTLAYEPRRSIEIQINFKLTLSKYRFFDVTLGQG